MGSLLESNFKKMKLASKTFLQVAITGGFLFTLAGPLKTEVICTFNGKPKQCTPNQGHMTPLTRGSDLDIQWGDGEITTIKFLGRNAILINGKTKGTIIYNKKVSMGVYEQGFKSASGNWFTVKLGD
jgi:hypothetical protein